MAKRRPGNHQVFVRRRPVVAGVSLFSVYRAVRYGGTVPADRARDNPVGRRPVTAGAAPPPAFRPAVVAADLDGTLIARDLSWAQGLPEALAALEAAGVRSVVCTGRMLQSARRVAARLGVTRGPVVCYQGALVADLASGEWLRHVPMDGEAAAEVVRHVAAMGRQLNAYIDDRLYVEQVTAWARRYAEHVEVGIDTVPDLAAEVVRRPPTKLVLVTSAADVDEILAGAAGALARAAVRRPLAARVHRVRRRLREQERSPRLALRAARGRPGAGGHARRRHERRGHARVGGARRRGGGGGRARARRGRPRGAPRRASRPCCATSPVARRRSSHKRRRRLEGWRRLRGASVLVG